VAYSIAKYNMSMVVLGLAAELRADGIAVNALWPRTAIATAAIEFIAGAELIQGCRKPDIMADAALRVLTSPSNITTGGFFIDDDVLRAAGATQAQLRRYSVVPGAKLALDYFVEDDGSLGDDTPTLKPRL
jgi:citronellol/citronellal dehydrogenase